MSFSNEWDECYQATSHLSIWPWSDLVSYVMRYARPKVPQHCRVLEIGCGAGANIPFFKWLGVDYHAVDGSPTVVHLLREKHPEFATNIKVADFTQEIPFEGNFDIIVDRASMTHNDTTSIRKGLSLLLSKTITGSAYIGIDWFSTNHSDYTKGSLDPDGFTKHKISDGQFAGVGSVHFSDQPHLIDLFQGFEIRTLEEKKINRAIPADAHQFASWNIFAVKI